MNICLKIQLSSHFNSIFSNQGGLFGSFQRLVGYSGNVLLFWPHPGKHSLMLLLARNSHSPHLMLVLLIFRPNTPHSGTNHPRPEIEMYNLL